MGNSSLSEIQPNISIHLSRGCDTTHRTTENPACFRGKMPVGQEGFFEENQTKKFSRLYGQSCFNIVIKRPEIKK